MADDGHARHIYRARMMPIWLEKPESTRFFTDQETAKAFLEDYIHYKYGWLSGEWREDISPNDRAINMRPKDGHGDARCEVVEIELYDDVPDDVSELERTELNLEWVVEDV